MVIGTELISEVKYIIFTAHLGEDRMSSSIFMQTKVRLSSTMQATIHSQEKEVFANL